MEELGVEHPLLAASLLCRCWLWLRRLLRMRVFPHIYSGLRRTLEQHCDVLRMADALAVLLGPGRKRVDEAQRHHGDVASVLHRLLVPIRSVEKRRYGAAAPLEPLLMFRFTFPPASGPFSLSSLGGLPAFFYAPVATSFPNLVVAIVGNVPGTALAGHVVAAGVLYAFSRPGGRLGLSCRTRIFFLLRNRVTMYVLYFCAISYLNFLPSPPAASFAPRSML